jgi:amino acid transporter
LVIGKLAIILFFLVMGVIYLKPENWVPFAPNGFKGISSAAAIIFFAYIGFDAVSTAAEETKNPQRGHADRDHRQLDHLHGACISRWRSCSLVWLPGIPWGLLNRWRMPSRPVAWVGPRVL